MKAQEFILKQEEEVRDKVWQKIADAVERGKTSVIIDEHSLPSPIYSLSRLEEEVLEPEGFGSEVFSTYANGNEVEFIYIEWDI